MSTDCLSNRSTWLVEQFLPGLGTPLESFGVAGRAVLRHLLGLSPPCDQTLVGLASRLKQQSLPTEPRQQLPELSQEI